MAISFCSRDEKPYLRDIQKLISQQIPVVEDHPFVGFEEEEETESPVTPQRPNRRPRRGQAAAGKKSSDSKKEPAAEVEVHKKHRLQFWKKRR
jgi:ATP-dependent RNA helicase RhlE